MVLWTEIYYIAGHFVFKPRLSGSLILTNALGEVRHEGRFDKFGMRT